jgi:hypothetical protein
MPAQIAKGFSNEGFPMKHQMLLRHCIKLGEPELAEPDALGLEFCLHDVLGSTKGLGAEHSKIGLSHRSPPNASERASVTACTMMIRMVTASSIG